MNKIFLLKGLNCPNCSAKIEKEVGELEYVSASEMNLMKQTLTVRFDNVSSEKMLETVTTIVHNHEPDVKVSEYIEQKMDDHGDDDRKKAIRLIIGAVFYIVGVLIFAFMDMPVAVELGIFIVAYIILGGDVVLKAIRNISKGHVFDENFLMSISTIGAFLIGEFPEAVAVMFFYQIGEMFQDMAVKRSRRSIADLMDIRPDTANVVRHGEIITVSPETVSVREIIMVKPGEKIPLDGVILDGESMLDTSALTGESVPRTVRTGDEVLSGCINESGVLTIRVTKNFGDSTASKIIDMVENAASRKAPMENFITKFARYYTPAVVIMAVLLAVMPPLFFDGAWMEWVRRSLVFLVISCPCALVISIPLTFFGGIGAASKHGVLVKGGNYLEALNDVSVIVFDKTGTLTKGVFNVTDIQSADGFTKEQILEYAAHAESYSNHPIAKSIISAYSGEIDKSKVGDIEEISGHGVKAVVNGKTVIAGNVKLMDANGIKFTAFDKTGTKVYIAVDGKYAGCILIADEVKADSKEAISQLKNLGVNKTVMLTGDDENIAKAVSQELELTEYYAQLLPNEKVEKLEQLDQEKRQYSKLVFVGDGINDAPVLARADIGIAMGGLGSDAAIEAADVVLMTDEPSKLVDAIQVAKATKRIVVQNIVIALGIKGLFLILGAFGIAGMWEAVFGDVGVAVIAILNAMRIMKK